MTTYCDTSLLVAALLPEAASKRVHRWLEAQGAGDLAVSDWTGTEFSSALSLKLRAGEISLEDRAAVLTAWATLRNASLAVLPVTPACFAAAAVYVEQADLGLRAGDALHLAVAAANGCALATLDRVQGKAATGLGIALQPV